MQFYKLITFFVSLLASILLIFNLIKLYSASYHSIPSTNHENNQQILESQQISSIKDIEHNFHHQRSLAVGETTSYNSLTYKSKFYLFALTQDDKYAFYSDSLDNIGLTILDLNNLNSPKILGQYFDMTIYNSLAVSGNGNFAFLVDDASSQIVVINATDKTNPYVIGKYGSPICIACKNVTWFSQGNKEYLFVTKQLSKNVIIANVTNPSNVTYVSNYNFQTSNPVYYMTTVNNGLLGLSQHSGFTIESVNLANILAPVSSLSTVGNNNRWEMFDVYKDNLTVIFISPIKGICWLALDTSNFGGTTIIDTRFYYVAIKLTKDGQIAYVLNNFLDSSTTPYTNQGLIVYNVSDYRTIFRYVTTYTTYGNNFFNFVLSRSNNFGILLSNDNQGMLIMNLSNPANPRQISSFANKKYFKLLVISQDFQLAFTASEVLAIFNISNPFAPFIVGRFFGEPVDIQSMTYSDSEKILYVSTKEEGLVVLDVSNVTFPKQLSTFNPQDSDFQVLALTSTKNIAFLADGALGHGLLILNVANKNSIVKISNYSTNVASIRSVMLSKDDKTAFILDSGLGKGFTILDVSNTSNPLLVGRYNLKAGKYYSLTLSADENTVFIADAKAGRGMIVLDVSNRFKPRLVGSYNTNAGFYNSLVLSPDEDRLFITDNFCGISPCVGRGLVVLDVLNVSMPRKVFQYNTGAKSFDSVIVSLNSNLVFIGDSLANRLNILEASVMTSQKRIAVFV